jgi:hypoxia up-regulated 1
VNCSRLLALDAAERAQKEREEAVNLLEGYIYRVRDILSETENDETVFKEFSTEEERVAIRTLLEETAEWLLSIDANVATSTLRAKKAALEYVSLQGNWGLC